MMDKPLRIRLQPKQKLFAKAVDKYDIVGYGGARGGGKSTGLRYVHLIRRFRYPGSTGVIFRKTFPELLDNHIKPMLKEFPQLSEYWRAGSKDLMLPNGSVESFRHCETMKDAAKYQGQEYQDLAYEEAGDLTEEMFDVLKASNRSGDPKIPARCQLTFNPGGRGHQWLKRRFIKSDLRGDEKDESYCFIQALLDDNPALMKSDPKYEKKLLSIGSEMIRRAWRWGDWDIEAGQYFSDLNRDIHFIEPFEIPHYWRKFGSYDHGWTHPAVFLNWAIDEDGNLYVTREFAKARQSIEDVSREIKSHPEFKQISIYHAGHDCWVDKGSAFSADQKPVAPTIAEQFAEYKIYLKPANITRIQGAQIIREHLRYDVAKDEKTGEELSDDDTKERIFEVRPKVFIFNTCPITYDCLSRMIHDPSNVEDVLKEDAKDGDPNTGDDAYDAFRYGLMSRYGKSVKPDDPKKRYSMMKRTSRPTWQTT